MLIAPAEAKTWYVDDSGGADFTSIQAAVDSASSGDEIYVYAGTYFGFDVNKPYLNIIGESADVVTVAPNDQGQYDQMRLPDDGKDATGTVIKGMKITAKPLLSSFGPALDCIIENCIFENTYMELGGFSFFSSNITIENNLFTNLNSETYSIQVLNCDNISFRGNTIQNSKAPYGQLALINCNNGIFTDNNFTDCPAPSAMISGSINCTFARNRVDSGNDVLLYDPGDILINLNNFGNTTRFTKVWDWDGKFIGYWNSTTPIKYTYSGKTYTGYMGNYWSNYNSTDANSDGIGDTPYVLPDNLGTDNYPLMKPFENYFNDRPVLNTIEVTPVTANLTTSSTQQFTATEKDQYGNAMSNVSFTWSSSNEAVGTVNSTGFFTPLTGGTTTITASAEGKNGTAQVTAEAPAAATISVSPLSSSLTPGGTQQFTAVAKDQAGNVMPDIAFTWSNNNETIGTVDASGLFTAKYFGTATVTAVNGAVKGTAQVTVTSTDLVASAIDAGSPVQGKASTVSITLKNTGPVAAGAFNVSLLANNTEVGRKTVDSLGINEKSSAVFSWTPPSYGAANLTAVVDPENAIDSNTANNVLSKTVTVLPSGPDLLVSAASFSNYPFLNNSLVVTVTNSGGGNAAAFNVTLLIDKTSQTVNIAELGAGNSTMLNAADIKRQLGDSVPVTVTIDPENTISEVNETNNFYTANVTIAASGNLYQGGRFSVGHDLVNNAVYEEGHLGVVYSRGGTEYTWFYGSGTVTYTPEDLPIPAGATIKSARLYQGWTWYGYPGFTVQFNGHESQGPNASYIDCINGQDVFDVTPYFNASGSNTAVITAGRSQRGYYGTVLVVIYEADSEPYRQIWLNEGSDCLLYGSSDPYVSYTMINNVSTAGLASAKLTTILESRDGDDGIVETLNGKVLNYTGCDPYPPVGGGPDPSFMYFDATNALKDGTNELGVNGSVSYTNYAASILEVTKETTSEANFSADKTSGDAPLTVKFTDTSTGTPTNRTWDFGDGGTSTEQNPTHIYMAEGTYNVKLTVSNSLGSDSEEKIGYITVGSLVPAPTANFSSNVTSGAAPLSVQFNDESTNNPTSWAWEFGDGSASNEQNPPHTYETAGNYTVKLTSSNYGGSNVTTKTDYITVTSTESAPVANFTTDANSGQVPFTVHFTDTSAGSVSSWKWSFGDGGTSNEQNPTHTYVTRGSYNVNLTATGPGGSNTATAAEPIQVSSPLTANSYDGGIPLTTVQNGTVSGGLWYDSYSAMETSAQKTFTLPTNTDIKWARLYVDVYDGHMQNNYRGNVSIGIDANGDSTYEIHKNETFNTAYSFPGAGGTGPVWVNDHMNRVTSDYHMWYDLTDAIEGQQVNVQATSAKIDSSFDGRIKAMVLVVAYDDGDSDQVKYWINQGHDTINPDDTEYTGSTSFGTSALASGWSSANLTAIYLASVDGTYTFNGTTLASGTKSGPYYGSDTWNISNLLTSGQDSALAYNKQSDNDYFKIPLVLMSVRYPSVTPVVPVANFTATPINGDAPLTVNFTDTSTGNVSSYAWDFDNDGIVDSTDQSPSHTYSTVGNYTVNLTVTGTGGSDSEVKTGYITVSEPLPGIPVAGFAATPTSGDAPLTVNFTDQSTGNGITARAWDFDNDGKVDSTEQSPVYTYEKAGNYTVNLTVANAGGSDSEVKTGYITVSEPVPGAPIADFMANVTSGAVPMTVQFTDNSTGEPTSWQWDFDNDGVVDSTEQAPIYTYATVGNYTVNLTVANTGGSDSEVKTEYIVVSEPLPGAPFADFTATPTSGNSPLKVQFKDASTGTVSSYSWDFNNDGNVDSTEQSPSYTYAAAGNYTVNLTVIGTGGIDSEVKTGYINVSNPVTTKPVAAFSASPTLGIMPLNVQFTDMSTGVPASWSWNFGDGNTSTDPNPSHTYSKVGKFTVSLTVKNVKGTNTTKKTKYIDVEVVPVAEFSANKTLGKAPLSVKFTDKSAGDPTSWNWDFGDGNTSTEEKPVHVYSAVGIYNVTLTATNAVGNNTTMKSDYIDVEGVTVADFSASSTLGIMPFNVSFTDLSTGVPTSWSWSFGDGNVSTEQNPSHVYSKVGTFTIKLTAKNAVGSNTTKKTKYIDVEVVPVAEFSANKTLGKAPLSLKFTDKSTGDPTSWNWDFGDGSNSTEEKPVHIYSEVGRYNITLTATNAVGNNTITKSDYIDVEGVPVAEFSANSTVGAVPFNVSFTDLSTGVPTNWSWSFGDGTTSIEQNPSHIYSKGGQYTVKLTAKNPVGSNSTTKTKYITVESIPVASFSASPTSGAHPLSVTFTDKSTGFPESWNWEFGDGSTSTEQKPVHTYSEAGKYTVNLTATNLAGSGTKSMSNYIKVS